MATWRRSGREAGFQPRYSNPLSDRQPRSELIEIRQRAPCERRDTRQRAVIAAHLADQITGLTELAAFRERPGYARTLRQGGGGSKLRNPLFATPVMSPLTDFFPDKGQSFVMIYAEVAVSGECGRALFFHGL